MSSRVHGAVFLIFFLIQWTWTSQTSHAHVGHKLSQLCQKLMGYHSSLLSEPNELGFRTLKMNPHYYNEEKGLSIGETFYQTQYLSEEERTQFAIEVQDGKILLNGELLTTLKMTDRFERIVSVSPGYAIFIMDADGQIYVSTKGRRGLFHHSSFNQGRPVAFAGEMQVEEGVLKRINFRSNHYLNPLPDKSELFYLYLQLHNELKRRDVDTSQLIWEWPK